MSKYWETEMEERKEREEKYMDYTRSKYTCEYVLEENAAKKAFDFLYERFERGKGPVSASEIISKYMNGTLFCRNSIRHIFSVISRLAAVKGRVVVQYPVFDMKASDGMNIIIADWEIQIVPIDPEPGITFSVCSW